MLYPIGKNQEKAFLQQIHVLLVAIIFDVAIVLPEVYDIHKASLRSITCYLGQLHILTSW